MSYVPQISIALVSWDHFLRPSHVEPKARYLTEAGPAAFDAALEQALAQFGKHIPSKTALPDKLIFALFELGCGRQSGLFQLDTAKWTFEQRSAEFGLLGTSQDVQGALIESFIVIGNTSKGLVHFVEENAMLLGSQYLVIALSSAISVAIYATTRSLERERYGVRSLIHLQELFHRPWLLFEGLATLSKIVKSDSNDGEIIATLISDAQQVASGTVWLEDVLSEVVIRTATPWLNAMAATIGLSHLANRWVCIEQ